MEVSKLTLSNELAHQMDVKTAILAWLKEHPKAGYNTSCTNLAKTMGLARDFKTSTSTGSIDQGIRRLVRMGLIMKHNINLIRADYLVNYGHPDMPAFINEGVIKEVKKEPAKPNPSPNEVFRANGKTLSELIIEWMKDNPMHLKETTTSELAEAIVADGKFQTTKESAQTVIARLVREGRVLKYKKNNKPRGKADFKVANVKYEEPEEEISPDYEYETLKTNKTPEEEQETMENNNVKIFKKLINADVDPTPASVLTEPKETGITQAIKLPDGSTVNLTININIGK